MLPAVAVVPGAAAVCVGDRHGRTGPGRRQVTAPGQGGHAGAIEHAVVDADLVEVAAAQEVVAALHLVGRHHPPGQAELVQCGVVVGGGVLASGLPAVDVQAHALGLVPGEGQVGPVLRAGVGVELEGNPRAGQVGIGDEGIETVSVPVDPQPGHVPATVVGVADAEDHERRLAHVVARAPEERQRAALGIEVARCVPGQHAVVGPLDRPALHPVGDDLHLVLEVGHCIAAGLVGDEALVGRDPEQQLRLAIRIGAGGHGHPRQCGGNEDGEQDGAHRFSHRIGIPLARA